MYAFVSGHVFKLEDKMQWNGHGCRFHVIYTHLLSADSSGDRMIERSSDGASNRDDMILVLKIKFGIIAPE